MIAENRKAQLLARFEPHGEALVYHHDPGTGGLPCSVAERDRLLADISAIYRRTQRWMTAWVLLSALGLAAMSLTGRLELEGWQQALVFLAPLPLAMQQWFEAGRLPWQRLGRRTPLTPPRGQVDSFWSRVAALPLSLAFAMLAVSGLLAWQLLSDGWQAAKDAAYVLPMIVPPLFSVLIFHAKWKRRRA